MVIAMKHYNIYIKTLAILHIYEKKNLLEIPKKQLHWLSIDFPFPNDPELKEKLEKTLSR